VVGRRVKNTRKLLFFKNLISIFISDTMADYGLSQLDDSDPRYDYDIFLFLIWLSQSDTS
jgi:hypothetical protein